MQRRSQTHRKQSRRNGIAIILAFLLVPMLFILLYLSSDQLHDDSNDGNSAAVISNNENTDDSYHNGEVLGASTSGGAEGDSNLDISSPDEAQQVEIIGTVYLTFDDGPNREITPGILDILRNEDVRATFFVLPHEGVDDIYRRIIDEGHEIGNHSFSHVYPTLYESGADAFREDILSARRFINDNFGYTTTSFRFPGGSMSWPDIIDSRLSVINELGYRHYDWLVDSEDWRRGRTADDIVREVLDQTNALGREHIIVLLHDYRNRHETVIALPAIISGLREMGYEFDIVRNYPADLRTGYGSKS